jgi:predicted P-loop ATPase
MKTITDTQISFYKNFLDKSGIDISVQEFLDKISLPTWKNEIEAIRAATTEEEKDKIKKSLACATIAGTFNTKTNNGIREFSGLMVMDFDKLGADLTEHLLQLKADPYSFAVWVSCSGKGICVLIKVQPERWQEAFEGAEYYYLNKFGLVVDKSGKNVSRLRFVSYDPDLFVNEKALLFKQYLNKKVERERKAPVPASIHTGNDLEYVIEQIEQKRIDITGTYDEWYRMGFALISAYGANAREYFHRISQFHPDYHPNNADRTFDYLLRYGARQITIATFYYMAKQAGLQVMTPQTKRIVSIAASVKKNASDIDSVVSLLKKMEDIPPEVSREIVTQVFESKEKIDTEETLFDQLETFLGMNYSLKRNEITRYLENYGEQQKDEEINDICIKVAKVFDMKISKPNVEMVLHSNFIPTYNPIKDFFREYSYRKPTGVIEALANTITHDMGRGVSTNYAYHFIRKWMIGFVSAVYGDQSPLVLVLTGTGNTGKTQWFRRLLPKELSKYYAETKFEEGKDDQILMCKKLLLMNDEFGGNTVKENKKFKDLTDKQTFTLRRPYGSAHEDLPRLAVLAGTSNDDHILNDPTGNRRIIPINVLRINHGLYNEIDKIDLFMEAYHAYQNGERPSFNDSDIELLKKHTDRFYEIVAERELAEMFFSVPETDTAIGRVLLSTTEIKTLMEKSTQQRISTKRLAQEMKALGFPYSDADYYAPEKRTKRGFYVVKKDQASHY